jgi:hypothetical protein
VTVPAALVAVHTYAPASPARVGAMRRFPSPSTLNRPPPGVISRPSGTVKIKVKVRVKVYVKVKAKVKVNTIECQLKRITF